MANSGGRGAWDKEVRSCPGGFNGAMVKMEPNQVHKCLYLPPEGTAKKENNASTLQ